VADGLAARGTYDDQVASLERYTQAQQRRLELSDMRFRMGVDPYLTVLTAQTDLYNAQQALVQARLGRLTNLVDLYQDLGGGWIEHTGDVPSDPTGFVLLRASAEMCGNVRRIFSRRGTRGHLAIDPARRVSAADTQASASQGLGSVTSRLATGRNLALD